MPKIAKPLSALELGRLTKPGVHPVGHVPGLQLHVSQSGARSWLLRATVGAKRQEMGLGPFPAVKLAEALIKARALRDEIAAGKDPVAEKRAAKAALIAEQINARTFDQCVDGYLASHEGAWKNAKHRQQWQNTLSTYASPVIGNMDVKTIGFEDVLRVLEPMWGVKTETATRLRGRIEQVLSWATVRKFRTGENPALWRGNLDQALPKPKALRQPENHKSVAWQQIPAFMRQLQTIQGMGAQALRLLIWTAARSGEVRGMRWAEVDLATGFWTVPAERMKAGVEHTVPLSKQAIELLKALPRFAGTDLVFPSSRATPLSDMTLSAVLKRMGVDATVHGFRSSFRMWAAESTNYPREVAEHALAHKLPDAVERAYQRGTQVDKRIHMMQAWAVFTEQPAASASITPIRSAA